MRSITFGRTSYFESRLDRDYEEEEAPENNLGAPSSSERMIPGQSQGSSLRMQEVIFYASENLFRESFVGHRELAMKKYCKCKFACDTTRSFQSYCYEFCGLLNIQMNDVKFYLGTREVPFQRLVRKPCVIEVFNTGSSNMQSRFTTTSLQSAFKELLDKGLYSDLEIVVNGEVIRAHKCLLIARSERFKALIESNMKESIENRVYINDPNISPSLYKLLIQWLYEGECDLPDQIMELLVLVKLTDEYLLPDLQKVCEDQIIDLIDGTSSVEILTNTDIIIPQNSEQMIKEAAKTALLEDYEALEKQFPDIEERISNVKGLMSELFIHKRKRHGVSKKRKNSIIGDDGQKKKVRFNISSTIYEEAGSARDHDESYSLIEPLSIYSNSSPPGEINDEYMVSSTHSSLHVGERRGSATVGGNTSNIAQFNDSIPQMSEGISAGRNSENESNIGSNNFILRSGSAGRGSDGNFLQIAQRSNSGSNIGFGEISRRNDNDSGGNNGNNNGNISSRGQLSRPFSNRSSII